MIRKWLTILLFVAILPMNAQKKGYYEGYVVNNEGDTIEGWVKDRSTGTFMELYSKVRFKSGDARARRSYKPTECRGYGYGGNIYETMPLEEDAAFFRFRYYLNENNPWIFLKVIQRDDPLTWYHWEYMDGESNYLDYIPLFYLEGSNEMARVTQGMLGLKRTRLADYFYDCPDLVDALLSKDLSEIQEVYNFYVDHCIR